MADKVTFELVSPERLLLSVEAEMVVVPGKEGDFAVLAGHAPVVSTLRPGSVELYEGDQPTDRYFVNGGVAEVSLDRLVVLAEEAIRLDELDRAHLERKIKDAEEDLVDAKDDRTAAEAQERLDQLTEILTSL